MAYPKVLGTCDKSEILHYPDFSCLNWWPAGHSEPAPVKAKPLHAVGVSVLLIEQGHVLLGKRGPATGAAQGWYSTPGGRLEVDESFEDCAVREFKEETGASLYGELKVIGFRKHFRFGQNYIMFYVFAHDHVGLITNPEGTLKCEGWNWFSQHQLHDEDGALRDDITEPKDILYEAFAEAERRKA